MNNKILIITVFISNIAFGNIVPPTKIETNISSNQQNDFSQKVASHLSNQGMEMEAIRKKIRYSFEDNEHSTYVMAQKIMQLLPQVKEQDIVNYFANSTLHGKKIDLYSYNNIVDLLQRTDFKLLNKENLEKVRKIII